MIYTTEVENMCPVAKGAKHEPAPIPEEGQWVHAKKIEDISGFTHGVGWCAPQQGACKLSLNVKNGVILSLIHIYLVNHGVPFRDAHGIVGQLVLKCIDKGISLDELSLEEYKEISPVFEQDIYEAISMKTCVEKRMTLGAPGPDVMEQVIAGNKKYLEAN